MQKATEISFIVPCISTVATLMPNKIGAAHLNDSLKGSLNPFCVFCFLSSSHF